MSKVKNVIFRTKLIGSGIVNFDSSEQRFMYNGTKLNHMKTMHENTSYAKKNFYENGEDLSYKITISSDCLRHDIFKEDMPIQSPNILNHEHVLYSFIASPASIIRGYLFASKTETLKRKGALTITDAEQTCNAVSHIETFSRSGLKNDDKDKTDNSFYKKEVIGNIKYAAVGNIDLMGLQFISCDKVFDRFSFNPDMIGIYKGFLKTKMPSFDGDLGYYQIKGSSIEIPELGLLLSNDNVIILVKELFKRVLALNIQRKGSFAKVNQLEYKLVYDVIEDTFESEDGWVTLSSLNDIEDINFDVEEFYVVEDLAKAETKRTQIETDYENRKTADAEKKAEKKAATTAAKSKKTKTSEGE